jgi:diguanylate cyclase
MRPQDTLSRFGGEEFVVLMPDTELDGGVAAMTRLQRELTRKFFMSGQDKLLITFSAGVAQVAEGESIETAIGRADQGMYQAKRAGKNKVVAA